MQGTFVVLPTLRPFAQPPPLPSLGLTEFVTEQVLGDDANTRIYEEEDPFERTNAGRFRLTLSYRLRSEGLISSFSLGSFGIRDGSERIVLGERQLIRGVDYEIDYDVGQVLLLEPEILFSSTVEPVIRASWEQRSLFQVTPTQVFGVRTHADIGSHGGIDFLGLYQSERSVVNRPILGTEPAAAILGGVSGRYDAPVNWMDRFLEAIPGLDFEGTSSFSADGEIAFSLPNPNTVGRSFVDDFDGASALPIGLQGPNWLFASVPEFRDGADLVLPPLMDESTAGSLVWQHSWVLQSVSGDSLGVHEGLFPRADIDNLIRVSGLGVEGAGPATLAGGSPRRVPSGMALSDDASLHERARSDQDRVPGVLCGGWSDPLARDRSRHHQRGCVSFSTTRGTSRAPVATANRGERVSSIRKPTRGSVRSGATAETRSACGTSRVWPSAAASTRSAIFEPYVRGATGDPTAKTSTQTATSIPSNVTSVTS